MRLMDRLLLVVVPPLAYVIIRLLYLLNRIDFVGEEHPKSFWNRGEYVILAAWHDQLLMMAAGYRGPHAKMLISASRDGELITRVMKLFGQGAVRGSSSRGGKAALKTLVALAQESVDLAITPDGPRGPRHELKGGVVQLARLTGRPVIPLAFGCSRGHRFASWDRFLLPYPFGRAVYAFGAPLSFEKGEDTELFKARLEEAMAQNQQRIRHHLEGFGVSAV